METISLATLFAKFFQQIGVTSAFGISGGAIVHFVDAIGKDTDIRLVFSTNELFAAYEADGLSRSGEGLGLCFSTSGPGMTNLLAGVAASYYDEIPVIVVTGQVASFRRNTGLNIRQHGFQEAENLTLFSTISVYNSSVTASNYEEVLKQISKHISHRTGPVHIEFPDDIQRVRINVEQAKSLLKALQVGENHENFAGNRHQTIEQSKLFCTYLESKRPVVLIGAGCLNLTKKHVEVIASIFRGCLFVSTWAAIHIGKLFQNYAGVIGTYSSLEVNSLLSSSDFLLVLGSRLSNNIIGSDPSKFCTGATKYIVDRNLHELRKPSIANMSSVNKLHMSIESFCYGLECLDLAQQPINKKWWESSLPIQLKPMYKEANNVVRSVLSLILPYEPIYLDTGLTLAWFSNILASVSSFKNRIFSAWNYTPMGYSVSAAIGYSMSTQKPSVAIIGDGGMLLTVSELALLANNNVPVLIVILDNDGHSIQRQTMECWLNSRYVGVSPESGLPSCNLSSVGSAFGCSAYESTSCDLPLILSKINRDSPAILHIRVSPNERCYPVAVYGTTLDQPKLC